MDVATQPTVVLDGSNMSSDNQKQRPQQCNATDGFEGYVTLFDVICLRLSYLVSLFLGMTSWNFICMLRNCPC